jgi:ABC-type multidrug transport system fused ATPase/permease subunit
VLKLPRCFESIRNGSRAAAGEVSDNHYVLGIQGRDGERSGAPGEDWVADSPPAPPALPASALVTVRDVARTYGRGATAVHALRGVSFTVAEGELAAVRGRSGSGKTTLLNVATHDAWIVDLADRVFTLEDGKMGA